MIRASCDASFEALAFFRTLLAVLPARSVSDRTCFRRLTDWLAAGLAAGRLDQTDAQRILRYAEEARSAPARNPQALFMHLLRKEMGYVPKQRP